MIQYDWIQAGRRITDFTVLVELRLEIQGGGKGSQIIPEYFLTSREIP